MPRCTQAGQKAGQYSVWQRKSGKKNNFMEDYNEKTNSYIGQTHFKDFKNKYLTKYSI